MEVCTIYSGLMADRSASGQTAAGTGDADTLEALAKVAPSRPIRSLRDGTRAQAVRRARTCYDHLAGELGVQITAGLLERQALLSTDGIADTTRRDGDPLSAQLAQHPYEIGPEAVPVLMSLGIDHELLRSGSGTRRPLVRVCLDWSEQRHHIAGGLGRAILDACLQQEWVRRRPRQRAVTLTPVGADRLGSLLGVRLEDRHHAGEKDHRGQGTRAQSHQAERHGR